MIVPYTGHMNKPITVPSPYRSPGRPREFDMDDALDKAIGAEGRAAETEEITKAVSTANQGANPTPAAAKTPAEPASGAAALAASPRVE